MFYAESDTKTYTTMKLTNRQKRFVAEYLVDLNATQASIRAGYSAKTAKEIGAENLTKPNIANAIQQAMDERGNRVQVTQDEVINDLRELRDICMGRKAIKVMTIVKNSREGTAEPVETEGMMFEPASANRALELLGKHIKMFTDKVEHTGKDGGPIQHVDLTDVELEERLKELGYGRNRSQLSEKLTDS